MNVGTEPRPVPSVDERVPIIDAHQHFWRYNDREYDWMTADQAVLKRDHLPAELEAMMAVEGVVGTVAVQARRTLAETEWLLQLAAENEFILGVVGWVDFTSAQLERDLERHSADPRLVGVRELIHDMPDVQYALTKQHVESVRAVQRAGLTYDLLLKPQHLGPATKLVDLVPEQRFVVDHIAKPNIASGEIEPWGSELRELAKRENVWCKLSGMVTEADPNAWEPGDFEPYVDIVLGAFGTSRVMVGSDWPVCTCVASYRETIGLGRSWAEQLSVHEQKRLLCENARDFYGLEAKPRARGAQGENA